MTKSPINNRPSALIAASLVVFGLVRCYGQGTMTMAFEGQPPGTFGTVSQYSESSVLFWNPSGPENLTRVGSGVSWAPDDGTAYLQMSLGGTLALSHSPLTFFNLVSLDLAGYWTGSPGPTTLHVVGYQGQGVTTSTDLAVGSFLDRRASQLPDFQTFYLGSAFANVYRVDISSGGFSIDNVVISGVPEPSATALLLLAAACTFGRSWIRRRRP